MTNELLMYLIWDFKNSFGSRKFQFAWVNHRLRIQI